MIRESERLIVDVLVQVSLLAQVVDDVVVSPTRPVMSAEQNLDIAREHGHRLVQIPGPKPRVPGLGAAQGVQIVHQRIRFFRGVEGL